ncbi:MAG: type III-A CRISPR-associated RAMP protein Csm4, partial [Firmicutes bacterium]|nr:type III-A CRISPR-associated RAMP protein Csm4 [Bacillota bacterium]
EAAFRYLGDAGVGGERGAGLGRFEPEFGELDLPPAQDGMRCVTLAPVIPAPGEEKHLESYRLLERGGWVYSPATGRTARKKRVAAVAEGSVFARPVKGSRPDVAPSGWPHPVWRYGLGFFVRVG